MAGEHTFWCWVDDQFPHVLCVWEEHRMESRWSDLDALFVLFLLLCGGRAEGVSG